jgi:hypothetical protein
MLLELPPDQRELADYMSELSEIGYYAGWMQDLEYELWECVLGRTHEYGRLDFNEEHRARLLQLSERCGGWIVSDDETEETWVPLAEWERRFAAWDKERDKKREK